MSNETILQRLKNIQRHIDTIDGNRNRRRRRDGRKKVESGLSDILYEQVELLKIELKIEDEEK